MKLKYLMICLVIYILTGLLFVANMQVGSPIMILIKLWLIVGLAFIITFIAAVLKKRYFRR